MNRIRHIAANIVFIIGLFLMSLGISFLLGSMAGISRLSVFGAFFLVIIGGLFAALAIKWNKKAVYLFFAAFLIQIGLYLFLSILKIIPFTPIQSWPMLSVFSGLSLLPAGWRYYRAFRYRYVIPAAAFVGLGCVLLIFSFKIVSFSFKEFIINWWPLLIVLTGILLVLFSLSSGQENRDAIK